ncbi:MAG: PhoH family protein [Candidatus Krumholzibacteria bacterium]|nr:PhoH family protein [Candidatus Krumholzibacteria bacterium]MDH4336295.1 PhoH family protein [Candidatus Krumholzibacteria bacterium]MDH5269666.1 PhoH family protein [Candidatus Krumholzibacteria bacterium]
MKTKKRVLSFSGVDPLKLFGAADTHLSIVDRHYPGSVVVRGDDIILNGTGDQIDRLTAFFREIIDIARGGRALSEQDFNYILTRGNGGGGAEASPVAEFNGLDRDVVVSTRRGATITPRTPGQKRYLDAIRGYDVVFGIGPAGTGKTYLAVAAAVAALRVGAIERVFLVRPVVEAGESLGFLPGDFQAKLDPYVRPVVDALGEMLGHDRTGKLMENGTIEIAPLAYMRGRTLNDAYVILDEAQNTTEMQMKMFLTRLGRNAKAVVNGDITQIDLDPPSRSGLLAAQRILKDVDGIAFVHLTQDDVVRHRLVQRIINAFDAHERQEGGEEPQR